MIMKEKIQTSQTHTSMQIDSTLLENIYNDICKTKNYRYTYGTAGFRDNATKLDTVMFTTGIIACLRSMSHHGKATGVMITASHNPPVDNGVKIIEPDGSMLVQSWESISTDIANIAANEKFDQLLQFIVKITTDLNINTNVKPSIIVGRDSRESSPYLMDCLLSSVEKIFNANVTNHQTLTTPQLHFLINYQNTHPDEIVNVEIYNNFFYNAWLQILSLYDIKNFDNCFQNIIIDFANGIGAPQFETFAKLLTQKQNFKFINDDYMHPEMLNNSCGADYVKTQQKLPNGINESITKENNLYCSFDGDADRIVFYYIDPSTQKFHLLDGDKISTLFAKFLMTLLRDAQLTDSIKLGVVQTAYANGSSTNYVTDKLQCPVSCTKTGVKHLHHEAQSSYDIGVYFEANGHGTILFSENFKTTVEAKLQSSDVKITKACKSLLAFSNLINQTVGDAIADLLGVLSTLLIMNWTPSQWDNEYTDLPNILTKVMVPDRSVFNTTDQERKLTSPPALQAKMDTLIAKVPQGRAFARASGTEDALRIYCEGANVTEVKKLSGDLGALILAEVN